PVQKKKRRVDEEDVLERQHRGGEERLLLRKEAPRQLIQHPDCQGADYSVEDPPTEEIVAEDAHPEDSPDLSEERMLKVRSDPVQQVVRGGDVEGLVEHEPAPVRRVRGERQCEEVEREDEEEQVAYPEPASDPRKVAPPRHLVALAVSLCRRIQGRPGTRSRRDKASNS